MQLAAGSVSTSLSAPFRRHGQQVRGTVWGARGPCLWLFIASIGRGHAPAMSGTARLRGESGEQRGEGVS
jgi:hypothetical protein